MNLKTLITIASLVSIAFGVYFHFETKFALARDLQLVELRLDQKITNDEIAALQKLIWQMEDRYQDKHMPDKVNDDIRDLKQYLEQLKGKKKGGG